jgi:hypothetical protein
VKVKRLADRHEEEVAKDALPAWMQEQRKLRPES